MHLQLLGPLPGNGRVRILEVLPEVVRPVEPLGRVALAELVRLLKMLHAVLQLLLRRHRLGGIPLAAVAALLDGLVADLEEELRVVPDAAARPEVTVGMQRVLVPLDLVLVAKAAAAPRAPVLILGFMRSVCS